MDVQFIPDFEQDYAKLCAYEILLFRVCFPWAYTMDIEVQCMRPDLLTAKVVSFPFPNADVIGSFIL
jgi:hypothetical protein